jgi:hypothetical protein
LSFSPQTGKVVKMFWVFHLVFRLKSDGKQTTFFTKNSAEKFEIPNQCLITFKNSLQAYVQEESASMGAGSQVPPTHSFPAAASLC